MVNEFVGKSTFLWYILVQRLYHGLSTIMEFENSFYLFDASGVTMYDKSAKRSSGYFTSPRQWILVQQSTRPFRTFTDPHSFGFVVHASSPRPERSTKWMEEMTRTAEFVMKPWGWNEIQYAAYVRCS